jgi:hypothetical protein
MKMIQILTVGILAFALNTYADDDLANEVGRMRRAVSDIESRLGWEEHDRRQAEAQRSTAEFNAHMNAVQENDANWHAQQKAAYEATLASPTRVIVVGQPRTERIDTIRKPTANQIAEYRRTQYAGTLEEVNQIQAMFVAIHNSGADIDPGLLHSAVYHPKPDFRKGARNQIFKSIRIQARSH